MRSRWGLRLAFAAVALALLVPGALLVRRALSAVAVEREARHRAVAERVFDEMERALSELLRREEERPVGAFRFYAAPEGAGPGAPGEAVSPLAALPEAGFVVGHFQVEPDGALHTPLLPAGGVRERALARGDLVLSAERADRAQQVLRVAGAWWTARSTPGAPRRQARALEERSRRDEDLRAGRDAFAEAPAEAEEEADARAKDEAFAQRPGTTVTLEKAAPGRARDTADDTGLGGAYEALQSLNRGAEGRAKRERKVLAQAAPPELQAGRAEASGAGLAETRERAAARPAPEPGFRDDAASPRAPSPSAPRDTAPAPALAPPPAEAPVLAVDPLHGRLVDERHLVLARTVLAGRDAYRQGVVLDAARLSEVLRRDTLDAGALPGAKASLTPVEPALPADRGGEVAYRYRHRFAEPFDALGLELRLMPLGEVAGAGAVYALSALLLAAGALGLFALYRMVAVAMAFSERRSNFAAAVSHELKTPLTAIRLYSEMLRDGLVPSEAKRREYVGTITDESERLSRLIDNVLEFSRLEKGTRSVAPVAAPLGPLVEEAAARLRPHAAREGFALEVRVEPGLPPARLDPDAVVQILFNLVDNALKYARGAGERRVEVAVRREGDGLALAVRDHGPGIAESERARVFEPFYRIGSELTRESRGAGIGLALVRGLAERMGGRVAARTAPGGGLEVTLTLLAAPGA